MPQTSDPLEELVLLSSRTQFAKIKKSKKKISPKINVKNIQKNLIAAKFAGNITSYSTCMAYENTVSIVFLSIYNLNVLLISLCS